MNSWVLNLILIIAAFGASSASAQGHHESDLRGRATTTRALRNPTDSNLVATRTSAVPLENGESTVKFVLVRNGVKNILPGLQVDSIHCNVPFSVKLVSPYFSVSTDEETPYTFTADLPCRMETTFEFDAETFSGQVFSIWQVAHRVHRKLEEAVNLDFWTKAVSFRFPSDGDYYWAGQVHLTRGFEWDITAHEMAHAIYDMGELGLLDGGPHLVDRCHSARMALSEGFATFLAGFAFFETTDTDPKFEFLYPRRAPVALEHVPADVCKGSQNEWQVAAYLWDLIDENDDGETTTLPFQRIWNAMKGTRAKSLDEVVLRILSAP